MAARGSPRPAASEKAGAEIALKADLESPTKGIIHMMRLFVRAPGIGVALGSLLLLNGSIAHAQQPAQAPQAPPAPQAPQAPQTPQTPQTPQAPTAAPQTAIVNPQPQVAVVTPDTEARRTGRVFTTGLVTFGLAYGASVIVAAGSNHKGDNRLYVPILGPWLDLGSRGTCPVDQQSCDSETTNKVLLVGDGIIQAAGALTMFSGLLFPEHRVLATKNFTVAQIVPVNFGSGRNGLAALGTF